MAKSSRGSTIFLLVVCFALGFVIGNISPRLLSTTPSFSAQSTNQLVGKWDKINDTGGWYGSYAHPDQIEFFPNGTLRLVDDRGSETVADYSVIDGSSIRIDIMGGLDSVIFAFTVRSNELILDNSGPFGTKTYRRISQ